MDANKYIGKFIGPDEIANTEIAKQKTYMGKERLRITFKTKESLPKEYPTVMVDAMITDKAIDLTELREKRVYPVVDQILTTLVESELTAMGQGNEVQYACGPKLTASLQQAALKVQEAIMGKKDYEVTLLDLDTILKGRKKTNKLKK